MHTAQRLDAVLAEALERKGALSYEEIVFLLSLKDDSSLEKLFAAAREVKKRCGKSEVLPRGLIEISNRCPRDCFYCGIRASNASARRYSMSRGEILECVRAARLRSLPAVAFQSGEIQSEANTAFYEGLLREISVEGGMEVTLSLGEQSEQVLRRWKTAAGDICLRYLLRIETSNRSLFGEIHPPEASFDRRVECIRTLKRLGYVTGSGVMIALPGQTVEDLARDVLFFQELSLDMVGMGPFIAHPQTPMKGSVPAFEPLPMALKMIAVTRLLLQDINIVAATALEALDPGRGRERAIAAGANVVMPNLTPEEYRRCYDLYPGKSETVS